MPCLLLIITLRFTFGEEKIDKTSKFPQNIMPMVVGNILFCIFYLYYQLQLLKTVIFWLKFIVSFWKNILDQT